jgi:hypothetical protein
MESVCSASLNTLFPRYLLCAFIEARHGPTMASSNEKTLVRLHAIPSRPLVFAYAISPLDQCRYWAGPDAGRDLQLAGHARDVAPVIHDATANNQAVVIECVADVLSWNLLAFTTVVARAVVA